MKELYKDDRCIINLGKDSDVYFLKVNLDLGHAKLNVESEYLSKIGLIGMAYKILAQVDNDSTAVIQDELYGVFETLDLCIRELMDE